MFVPLPNQDLVVMDLFLCSMSEREWWLFTLLVLKELLTITV
jgi:hypothetical protein